MKKKTLLKTFLKSTLLIFALSCIKDGKIDFNELVDYLEPSITTFNVSNDAITITGTNLHTIENITLDDGTNNHEFVVNSQSPNSIVGVAKTATTLLLDTAYSVIVSNALGQSSFSVTFQLQSGAVGASNLAQMGATDGQVLKWDNTAMTWIPSADVGAGGGGGTVTQVTRGTGILNSGTNITVSGTVAVDVGTTTGKIPQIGTVATGKTGIEISDSTNAALTLENGGQEFGIENNGTNFLFTDITGTSTLMSLTTAGVMAVTGNITSGGTSVCRQDGTNCAAHVPDDGTVTTAKLNTASVDTRYVNLSGDTLTGTLNLATNGFTVGTTQMVVSSGDVGIGTGSPAEDLHVVGTGSSRFRIDGATSASLRLSDTGAGANSKNIDIINDGGDLIFRRLDDDFSSNPLDALVIKNDGKIGIGTSSPDNLFHLETTGVNGFTFKSTINTSGGAEIDFKHDRAGAILQSGDNVGGLDFQGYDGTTYLGTAKINAFVDGTPGTNDMPGRLVFSTTADGANSTTERMRISNNGSVSIGNTAPGNHRFLVQNDVGTTGSPGVSAVGTAAIYGVNHKDFSPSSIPSPYVPAIFGLGHHDYSGNSYLAPGIMGLVPDGGHDAHGGIFVNESATPEPSAGGNHKITSLASGGFAISVFGVNDRTNIYTVNYSGNAFATTRSGGAIDVAEWIKFIGEKPLPGETVCLVGEDKVQKCQEENSRKVAGVVTTKPHLVMGDEFKGPDAIRLTLTGRVPVFVKGDVSPGDLLSSTNDGRAQKCNDPIQCFGKIIGKATTHEKEGQVMALITLQ